MKTIIMMILTGIIFFTLGRESMKREYPASPVNIVPASVQEYTPPVIETPIIKIEKRTYIQGMKG